MKYTMLYQALSGSRQHRRQVVLKERLWSLLPEELIEMILAHLPVQTLLRFRTVCKKWSALVLSPEFRSMCAQLPCRSPWVVLTGIPRPHKAENELSMTSLKKFPLPGHIVDTNWLAISAGLMCYASDGSWEKGLGCLKTFIVYNPISRQERRLPPLLENEAWIVDHVSLSSSLVCDSYKVFVTGRDAKDANEPSYCMKGQIFGSKPNYITAVYDSTVMEWDVSIALFPGPKLERHTSALVNNCFYGLAKAWHFGQHQVIALVCYNLQDKAWIKFPIWRTPSSTSIRNVHLVDCKGVLYAVEFLQPGIEAEYGSIAIWRFNHAQVAGHNATVAPAASVSRWAQVVVPHGFLPSAVAEDGHTWAVVDADHVWSLETKVSGVVRKTKLPVEGCFAHEEDIFVVAEFHKLGVAAYNIRKRSWRRKLSFGIDSFEELGLQGPRIACLHPEWHTRV